MCVVERRALEQALVEHARRREYRRMRVGDGADLWLRSGEP
jgi:hypothetical protein